MSNRLLLKRSEPAPRGRSAYIYAIACDAGDVARAILSNADTPFPIHGKYRDRAGEISVDSVMTLLDHGGEVAASALSGGHPVAILFRSPIELVLVPADGSQSTADALLGDLAPEAAGTGSAGGGIIGRLRSQMSAQKGAAAADGGQMPRPAVMPLPAMLPIGTDDETGEDVFAAPVSTLVFGESGTGKTGALNSMLESLLGARCDIVFFDGKRVEALRVASRCWSVCDADQAGAWMAAMREEIERRRTHLAEKGKSRFSADEADRDALPFSDEFPPVVVFVDELAIWQTPGALGDDAFVAGFSAFVELVAVRGPEVGIALMAAAQNPRRARVSEAADAAITQRIAFRLRDAVDDRLALGGDIPRGEPRPSGIGDAPLGEQTVRCCARTAFTDGKVRLVNARHVGDAEMRAAAGTMAHLKVEDDLVGRARRLYRGAGGFQ